MWLGRLTQVAAAGLVVAVVVSSPEPVLAVPAGAIVSPALDPAHWVEHRVLPGEKLREIAARYDVRVASLIEWNKLDKKRPRIRAGRPVRVKTSTNVPPLVRKQVEVQKGDSWHLLARRYGVKVSHLRTRWNRKVKGLRVGDRIVVYVDDDGAEVPSTAAKPASTTEEGAAMGAAKATLTSTVAPSLPEPEPELEPPSIAGYRIVEVPPTSIAIGRPNHGRLRRSREMPANPGLYTVRNPIRAHATSLTIMSLQTAFANFRGRTGFDRELTILDISQKGGGKLRPHKSHRAGRDVDLRLPLAAGEPDGTVPVKVSQVDWDMTWKLIESLIATGQVRYIFLSRTRQRRLYRAAQRAGAAPEYLQEHLQFPSREKKQTVRHSRGHDKHMHIRFNCAADNKRCRD